MSDTTYFVNKPAEEAISKIDKYILNWGKNGFSAGVFSAVIATYWRNHSAYYSAIINPDGWTTSLGFTGSQGELVKVTLPVARTLTTQFVTLITRQRLNFEVLTNSTDAIPMQTARIGKALCEDIKAKHNLDEKIAAAAEKTAVLGACFISSTWRSDAGYIYAKTPEGNPMYSGDDQIEVHDMLDVVYDWSCEDINNLDWITIKRKRNRYDLMSQYEELADEIASLPSVKDSRQGLTNYGVLSEFDNDDMIYVYEFYHRKTPAVPEGRMVAYGSVGTIFYDDVNPYECIPVFPLIFEKINNTSLGYPMFSNLLPAQEMLDHSASVQASNQSAFGVQSLLVPRGSDISTEALSSGLNAIYYSEQQAEGGGIPKPLEMPTTPPEVGNFMRDMNTYLGNISMINDTLRGQPPANVSSGAMAATLSANAMEFLTSAQKSITLLIEKVVNQAIKNFKLFSSMEQLVDIVGIGNITYAKQFKDSDIKSLNKIKVSTMSPMLSSSSGRIQVADSLLQNGLLKNPEMYFQILEGQDVSVLYKDSITEQTAIQAETDAILDGDKVQPLIFDNHPKFIKSYQALLYNPYVRTNGRLVQTVIALMQERMNMEMTIMTNPMLAQMVSVLRGEPAQNINQMQPSQGSGNGAGIPTPPGTEKEDPKGGKLSKPAQPAQPQQNTDVQQPIGMEVM